MLLAAAALTDATATLQLLHNQKIELPLSMRMRMAKDAALGMVQRALLLHPLTHTLFVSAARRLCPT
jgi:hypothetical protein